jgi:hypothetical protein
MNEISSEQSKILHSFLIRYLHMNINVHFGDFDPEDGIPIVINGTLIDFDQKFIRIRDTDGRDMVISLKHVRYVSEGWSDDVLRVERGVKA